MRRKPRYRVVCTRSSGRHPGAVAIFCKVAPRGIDILVRMLFELVVTGDLSSLQSNARSCRPINRFRKNLAGKRRCPRQVPLSGYFCRLACSLSSASSQSCSDDPPGQPRCCQRA